MQLDVNPPKPKALYVIGDKNPQKLTLYVIGCKTTHNQSVIQNQP